MSINIIKNTQFVQYINKIIEHYKQHNKVVLGCWCLPKQYHCETIKKYIISQKDKSNNHHKILMEHTF